MDSFGRIAEIIAACLLLFLVPLRYTAEEQDMLEQTRIMTEAFCFVDSVRNAGYLSKDMYEAFLKKLYTGRSVLRVELSHYRGEAVREGEDAYRWHNYGIYTEQIVSCLYGEEEGRGIYRFRQGDYFSIKIKNQGQTLASRLSKHLTGRDADMETLVVYGGAIRDEAY